jgi:transketolase
MPSWELFDKQPQDYKNEVLPPNVTARFAIEMGRSLGWDKYIGTQGSMLTIDTFGASAPDKVVMEKYGFTAANVVKQASKLVAAK